MRLIGGKCVLRPWHIEDAESLTVHASNRKIWRNLLDRFPVDYSIEDAREWLNKQRCEAVRPSSFAIDLGGSAVGAIGFERLNDVRAGTAKVGYWLGESFWGQGIGTEAVRLFADYAFEDPEFKRLEASVFEWNPASCRVLEKAGFSHECFMRDRCLKDGRLIGEHLYARLRNRR